MLYLADANVLITANNLYYPIDRVPEYWEWLTYMGSQGHVKMPFEIFEEVKDGPDHAEKDLLFAWLQEDANKKALLLDEKVDAGLVQKVIAEGYAPDLTDDEVEQIGRDPFLIAYCLVAKGRCVVTVETSAPKKQRQNRKVPDVCKGMGELTVATPSNSIAHSASAHSGERPFRNSRSTTPATAPLDH